MDPATLLEIGKYLVGFLLGILASYVVERIRHQSRLRELLLERVLHLCVTHYNALIVWSRALLLAVEEMSRSELNREQYLAFVFPLCRFVNLHERLISDDARYTLLSRENSAAVATSYGNAWAKLRLIFSDLSEESQCISFGAEQYLHNFEAKLKSAQKVEPLRKAMDDLMTRSEDLQQIISNLRSYNRVLDKEVTRIYGHLWGHSPGSILEKLKSIDC